MLILSNGLPIYIYSGNNWGAKWSKKSRYRIKIISTLDNKIQQLKLCSIIFVLQQNQQLYSIIYVPNPVIVPGGRFREFYYWDSYWIIRGLLYSEMYQTAKGMLNNFLEIIDRFGFIPNGGRIYYAARTQPPLLAAMIKSYVDKTKDYDFIKHALPLLEREFYFFKNNHMVNVRGHSLAVYGDKSSGPRPESYREDVEIGLTFNTEEERQEFYSELKAGAESGMDYSSRWFINKNGTNEGTLKDLKCRSIVAVDLNALLFWNAKLLVEFSMQAGNATKAAEFEKEAQLLYAVSRLKSFIIVSQP